MARISETDFVPSGGLGQCELTRAAVLPPTETPAATDAINRSLVVAAPRANGRHLEPSALDDDPGSARGLPEQTSRSDGAPRASTMAAGPAPSPETRAGLTGRESVPVGVPEAERANPSAASGIEYLPFTGPGPELTALLECQRRVTDDLAMWLGCRHPTAEEHRMTFGPTAGFFGTPGL